MSTHDMADMASLCIWMHPFAVKGLESQYTDAATLLCGNTEGFSNNAAHDGNEQMTAHRMCINPFKGANLREHQGRRRQVKFPVLQGVLRTLPSVTVSN